MKEEALIQFYIQQLCEDGFFKEDENYYIKNIGSRSQQVFYDAPDRKFIRLIVPDYIEGREIDLAAKVDYITLKNFETGEDLKEYIDNFLSAQKDEYTKEIICVNAMEDIQIFLQELGYNCTKIIYDYPYKKGYGFEYEEYPSGTKYEYRHIAQTDFISIIEKNEMLFKTTILNYLEIQNLNKNDLVDSIKERLNSKITM